MVTIDATKMAIEIIGRPIPNTIMVGAFCGITGIVSLDGLKKAIDHKFEGKAGVAEKNKTAVEQAFKMMKK